ncbi:hypothetical protein [Streptomyces phaeoluteigriseus]
MAVPMPFSSPLDAHFALRTVDDALVVLYADEVVGTRLAQPVVVHGGALGVPALLAAGRRDLVGDGDGHADREIAAARLDRLACGAVGAGERLLELVLPVGGDDVRAGVGVGPGRAGRRHEHPRLERLRLGRKLRARLQQLLQVGFVEGDAVGDPVAEARHHTGALVGEAARSVGGGP